MSAFFEAEAFRRMVDEFYPTALTDNAGRWREYSSRLEPFEQAAQQAMAAVEQHVVRPVRDRHPNRFVCRIDGESLTKSPRSIDDKLYRYLVKPGKVASVESKEAERERLRENRATADVFIRYVFEEMPGVMADLARFRLTANFLRDANELVERFLSVEEALRSDGVVLDPAIDDRIEDDRWEAGSSGHRAIHVRLEVGREKVPVEVLIMTILQVGWDAKSHVLYDIVRRGGDGHTRKRQRLLNPATSEMLYVADVVLDGLFGDLESGGGAR